HALSLTPFRQSFCVNYLSSHPCGRIERGDRVPVGISERIFDQLSDCALRQTQSSQASSERVKKRIAFDPGAPIGGENNRRMYVEFFQECFNTQPSTDRCRIHHLHKRSVPSPDDAEMGTAVGKTDDDDGGQRVRFREKQMIDRNHRLLSVESQGDCYFFESVNRSAVNVRLTGFAQSTIAYTHAETFEQAFERGRPA